MKGICKNYIINAARQAEKSPMSCKHGAVIVKNGKIISKGHNINYSKMKHGKYSLHAEVSAIVNCYNKELLKGSKMYVVRVNNQGWFKISKPCPHCASCVKKYNISTVYYSTEETNQILNRI